MLRILESKVTEIVSNTNETIEKRLLSICELLSLMFRITIGLDFILRMETKTN